MSDIECEQRIEEFCKWLAVEVIKIRNPQDPVEQIAKDVLKKVLPAEIAPAIDDIIAASVSPKGLMLLMPELSRRIIELMDNLCEFHKAEVYGHLMPMFAGLGEVISEFGGIGMGLIEGEKEEAAEAEKKFNGDDTNLN